VHTQRHKKKEEEKGFDALEAAFLEKGLVAAGSAHSMGLRAVGETQAHRHRHHKEKEKAHKHKAELTKGRVRAHARRTVLGLLIPVKIKQTHVPMPPRMRRRDDIGEPRDKKKK